MRHTASVTALLVAALVGGLLTAPAAHAKEEPWEKAFVQGKEQQDLQIFNAAKSAGQDEKALVAKINALVARYRQAMQTQGSALSYYLFGRILFKQSEAERHRDKRKKEDAIRAMEAAQARGAGWFAKYALAYIHFTTGDVKRGEAMLTDLLRTHSDREEVMTLHAQLMLGRGRFADLKTLAERLLKKNINNMRAREFLAMAYMGLKEWKRAERAIDSIVMRGDQRLEPRLWKVECIVQQKDFPRAEQEVLKLIRGRPKNVGLRLVYVDVLVKAKQVKRAIPVMKQVVDFEPTNVGYLGRLSELHLDAGQPAEAEKLLLRALARCEAEPKASKVLKPYVLRNLAIVSYAQKRYEAVAKYLEDLARLGELAPHLLDLQQQCYARLKRTPDRIRTLKKLREHMDGRPEQRKQLDQLIAALERGEEGAPGQEIWGRSQLAELIERCAHKDPKVRREALRQYYDLDLPFVDPVVYQRHDHRIESDPECRRIVVQILGRYRVNDANAEIVRIAARYVGFALEDPDQSVRMIAAQELGRIGAPAGIIYLMPYLGLMKLDTSGLTAASREALEKEYNAARSTLSTLTGRQDIEPGAPNWIKVAAAPKHQQAWLAWYDGPDGAIVRAKALSDLDTVERVGPRWPLRYVLSDLMKEPRADGRTTPPEVWVQTYKLLRRHIQRVKEQKPAEFKADPWWPTFPMWTDESLKLPEERAAALQRIAPLRQKITAWWSSLRERG
ncbi:MAG: hypothetical protein QNJ90_05105 [Planctomycetota bacterium]|nr:hypothetical protein [Planctomycetota bacterium]